MIEGRDDVAVEQDRRLVDAGDAPSDADSEAPQDAEATAGPVQGVRAEVEVEAVPTTGAGTTSGVLGGLQQEHWPAGTAEGGGGRQPGQAAADDDGSWLVHAIQTNERRLL